MAKAKAKLNVSELLKANNKAERKASGVPKHRGTVQDRKLYDRVHSAYLGYKDAEAAFRSAESELLEKTNDLYAANAQNGSFSKSYDLEGEQTPGVQVTYQDRFSNIPVDAENELREILGDEYDTHFFEKRELEMRDTSDEIIEMLVEKLGQDVFEKIFKIKVSIAPNKDMDKRQFKLPEQVRAFLKQYKASVKVKSEE